MEPLMLDRREFVAGLLRDRGDLLVVSGLGSPTYDVAACGDHARNFYLWGAMGGAAMTGLALARPEARVLVVTGDGEMLMGMGSIATIGVKQPPNLVLVVLDNGHYGETGMQASHTRSGIDLVGIAAACRFATALSIADMADLELARRHVHETRGPVLMNARIGTSDVPRVLPGRDGHANRLRFMQALGA
jgi:thiamine pyrophosphate-dependent acetolactate synthase large subunit-like protein